MNSSKFLTLLILIGDAFLIEAVIRACHLNAANTTSCYRENTEGMIKILRRHRIKPNPLEMDDVKLREPYGADGIVKVDLYDGKMYNLLAAGLYDLETAYDGVERSFTIDTMIKIPNVSKV